MLRLRLGFVLHEARPHCRVRTESRRTDPLGPEMCGSIVPSIRGASCARPRYVQPPTRAACAETGPLLLLIAATVAGCGSDGSGPTGSTRFYRMGFSALPPRADTAIFVPTSPSPSGIRAPRWCSSRSLDRAARRQAGRRGSVGRPAGWRRARCHHGRPSEALASSSGRFPPSRIRG
jgi:hypothetical protein